MSVISDDLYATVFRISQGDLDLFKSVTDEFLESVKAPIESTGSLMLQAPLEDEEFDQLKNFDQVSEDVEVREKQ